MPANFATLQSLKLWGGIVFCSLITCSFMGAAWEKRLGSDSPGIVLRNASPQSPQIHVSGQSSKAVASQKILETNGVITADYSFVNFNNDPLGLRFSITSKDLSSYRREYGYTQQEKTAIDQWQKSAMEEAYKVALKSRQNQQQLTLASEKIVSEYNARLANFFRSRGFALLEGNLLVADIPAIVRRNISKVKSIALSLNSSGEKLGYDSDRIITAAISFVQTAILYGNVPVDVRGRQTGGIYPPLETLASGKGDCDTKSALIGAILLNWDRIKVVGVGVPGHYLIGVLRNPAKGDAYVEYKGVRYVLVEPAGPGWLPPGTVDRKTLALLNASEKVKIEPFTAN